MVSLVPRLRAEISVNQAVQDCGTYWPSLPQEWQKTSSTQGILCIKCEVVGLSPLELKKQFALMNENGTIMYRLPAQSIQK